jgi:hypothetical protein
MGGKGMKYYRLNDQEDGNDKSIFFAMEDGNLLIQITDNKAIEEVVFSVKKEDRKDLFAFLKRQGLENVN